nr:MAG TPA: hypothetical protein [Caudoviricetes sp.]
MPAILDAMRKTTSSGAQVKAYPHKANRPEKYYSQYQIRPTCIQYICKQISRCSC